MKLKNKKTGEIVETDHTFGVSIPTADTFGCKSYDQIAEYDSLAELCEDWEDYEETPKTYWRIYIDGGVIETIEYDSDFYSKCRKIGNYFKTKEEAEKAIEKLKAWKRLKDAGFKFRGLTPPKYNAKEDIVTIKAECNWNAANIKDLDLLFGGEE